MQVNGYVQLWITSWYQDVNQCLSVFAPFRDGPFQIEVTVVGQCKIEESAKIGRALP